MHTDFLCQFFQWQLRMDTPELAYGKNSRDIFCMKSNSVNGNVAGNIEIFRNFTYKFFKNYPE